MLQKPGTPSSMPSKTTIFNWIKQIIPDSSPKMKVEDLGDGVIYCKIINHYFPGTINTNRLNTNPKNQYDFSLNLKLFQNAIALHKITVPFDVGKIAKQKFLQNWGLVNGLYRQLSPSSEDSVAVEDSKSVSYVGPKFTPKRSFESAFPTQPIHKLPEAHTFTKPVYNPQTLQPAVHYQSNQMYSTQSLATSQVGPHDQNRVALTNSYPQTQISNQSQVTSGNGTNSTPYNPQGITQNPFGGYSFGINSNPNTMNIAPNNQNLNFIRLDSIVQQPNKGLQFDQPASNKCWSVGKLPTRESFGMFGMPSQENSGKYSVNSHIFQNNCNAVIDRVKEILLKNSHDIEKIRQIKILLNIPLNEDMIKIEEEENVMMNCSNSNKIFHNSGLKEKELKNTENKIETKESMGLKQKIEMPESKSSKSLSNGDPKDKENQDSRAISNSGSCQEVKQIEKPSVLGRVQQSSGKKIRNNFLGEGAVFRK